MGFFMASAYVFAEASVFGVFLVVCIVSIESRLLSLQLYSLVDIINESANYTSLRYCD